MTTEVQILPDTPALARAAAGHILNTCSQAIRSRHVAYLALAGGGTPRAAYSLLSQPEYATRIDWSRLQVFWSDERLVPPDHADSNYRLAVEALLMRAPIPPQNIHRMRGELAPTEAAQQYEAEMRNSLSPGTAGFPCFDLMMVGMGDDGHIASLFPGSPALHERSRWVVASEHNQPPPPLVPRLTLTLPVINAASEVLVIVTGEKKAERIRQVLEGESAGEPLPAQLINPSNGRLLWLLDHAAAGLLTSRSDIGPAIALT
jgi:6-phosphogluconolactonase